MGRGNASPGSGPNDLAQRGTLAAENRRQIRAPNREEFSFGPVVLGAPANNLVADWNMLAIVSGT